ncbi:histidine phosphatase family protein [Brachybacterium ginsengisoli]|uniref:Histidine phosphatase family protein n=1 Tax=Brachybacterium ginsengisoli TaxID=1331682 RepID=A0A291GWG1_9MICO|nr:histidine phosphatase family protein [Brachybacterium ginsengisoli]ATG54482.1 histidine phosphatase family protein [Brachybacterium ginsengisoli]
MTLFGLVRHGQTDYNLQDLFQGSSDIPLNDTGIAQAHAAFDALPAVDWDVVLSSPLQRAEQTARIIGEDHAIPFGGTEPRLVEIDWGEAEGRPVREMEEKYPERAFPGREDHQAVADRGYDALEALEERYPGKKVLLVAHGTLIRFLLSGIIEQPLPSIPNATLSVLELEGTTWHVSMVAGQAVDHTVEVADRSENPRFILEKSHLTPAAIAARDAASHATAHPAEGADR